ncbi:MAG: V-type ATPase subunit [Nitrosopumilus sp.]|nr:V-type ATPase subunit [Nitrosopumilus sp.]
MASGIVFASVKSYSKRGKLLGRARMQTLAESRDLDELVTRIRNTDYSGALSDLQKPYTSDGIESAIRGRLAETHHNIAKTAGGAGLLEAYYMRFAVTNLKQILRGKALGRDQAEIERRVNLRAEELAGRRDVAARAMAAGSLEEAVSSLSQAEFGAEVSKAAALYGEGGNVQVFDAHLDRVLYTRVAKAIRSTGSDAAKLASMDVDFYNMMAVVRSKLWGLDEEQVRGLVVKAPGGALLDRMIAAGGVREALAEVSSTRYGPMVPESGDDLDLVAGFERSFEAAMYAASRRAFTKMLNLVTTVAITKLTAYEARNIAAVAYAVEQGIPAPDTMKKLVLEP